jgi:RND family efflux transporter MFP subunit
MTGDARVIRYIIPVVPNVKGRVAEPPIEHLQHVKKGDVLFRIEPRPYQARADHARASLSQHIAQRDFLNISVKRAARLVETSHASKSTLDEEKTKLRAAEASIESAEANLDHAEWELEETVVRAPSDGFPAAVQLREGSMVTTIAGNSPIAFVSTEDTDIVGSFSQGAIRKIKIGDPVEITFASRPGEVLAGRVTRIGETTGESQLGASSKITAWSGAPARARWPVMIELDDGDIYAELKQGAGGKMAVYTDAGKPFHAISKVTIRISSLLSYLTSG